MRNKWIEKLGGTSEDSSASYSRDHGRPTPRIDKYADLRETVHREVVDEYNRRFLDKGEEVNKEEMLNLIYDLINRQEQSMTRIERSKVAQEIFDEVVGLGPLEPLLRDDNISEIMVNSYKDIYVERGGKLEITDARFVDNDHVLKVINRIVSPLGRRIDESSPMVDARLPDGSRVNAVISPIAIKGPSITIRKFSPEPFKMNDLIGFNSLSHSMAHFLEAAVKGRANIIVSGGTGSGKTTLLNVISNFIQPSERIVTIEDAAELKLAQDHVVSLESRPSNVEGKGTITIRDLVVNALRMRPDRIIVGEVRSNESLDMLQAMNTGHEGSLTTVHANSPRDVISRMETMVMMAGMDLPIKAIREQIASAIDLVVHQSRFRDGSRKIVSISEIVGLEGDTVTMQEIYRYNQTGYDGFGKISGEFVATGINPKVVQKIKNNGVLVMDEWFRKD